MRDHDAISPVAAYLSHACLVWTSNATGPFCPAPTANSTFCPSSSVRYPLPLMDEKCTKMSSPLSLVMNPKPLLASNHFTVPASFALPPSVDGVEDVVLVLSVCSVSNSAREVVMLRAVTGTKREKEKDAEDDNRRRARKDIL